MRSAGAALTLNSRGTAVIDLRHFLQSGPFLDVSQQGIPSSSSSSSATLELGSIGQTSDYCTDSRTFHMTAFKLQW